ncbi:hypothetical protein [Hymenobacter swuensis]|uniref:hypothetical protein n=1 Tax=Hymenobacter swuensis TaxID=1446467 RepID=UPI0012DCCFA2|nr:hypothetical protein [Hymenobacter swuensis]
MPKHSVSAVIAGAIILASLISVGGWAFAAKSVSKGLLRLFDGLALLAFIRFVVWVTFQ